MNTVHHHNSTSFTGRLPWRDSVFYWSPFKIDALGLVTLLGAEEIDSSLGRLVPSRYLEYFPLLGAFIIAGERFKEKKPSFNLYNLTDGIHTTDLSFWFTRWITEQEFELTRSVVHFEAPEVPRTWLGWHLLAASLSFVFVGFLCALTFCIGDWYGLANAIAMIISIFTRAYSMQAHRNSIDRAINEAAGNQALYPDKKIVVITADSKAVTIFLPGRLMIPVFSYNPEPRHRLIYHLVRYIGWIVFGAHVVTIGMASLAAQLYTVGLIVIPTVLICWKLGCDDSKWQTKWNNRVLRYPKGPARYECWIGSRLKAYISEWPIEVEFEYLEKEIDPTTNEQGCWVTKSMKDDKPASHAKRSKKRQDLYAWLNLNTEEEASFAKWDLLPHTRNGNESWWKNYQAKKRLISHLGLDLLKRRTYTTYLRDAATIDADKALEKGNGTAARTVSKGWSSSTETPAGIGQAPKRTSTWLSSNGFVVDDANLSTSPVSVATSPTALASVRAGMMALDPHGWQRKRPPLSEHASTSSSSSPPK